MNEETLFAEASAIESPDERCRFLDTACADNVELRQAVEKRLRLADDTGSFQKHPPFGAVTEGSASSGDPDVTMLHATGSTEDGDAGSLQRTLKHDEQENDDELPRGYLPPSSKPDSIGKLGHYEVLEVVGRGAFGTVLRAFDEKLQRVVAIKVLAPEMAATSPARKRFLREARTSAAIRHENVVDIHAVEDEPIPYLVMEYIPGPTLQQRLDQTGPLPVLDVLKLGKQIADGLAAAHAQDLIHRDIKPGNILLDGGVNERVKITDFGLARAADDASVTQSGLIAGTPMYMAPEQALGEKLDQRADLFSFGSVLYQMLSGRPPFRAANTVAVLKRVVEDTPRPIQEIIPEVPTWMCEVVSQLHAKHADERIQTAKEVSDLLGRCIDDLKAGRVPKITSSSPDSATMEFRPSSTSGLSIPSRTAPKPHVRVAAVALMLLPLMGLVITEIAGVTHLFRQQPQPGPAAITPEADIARKEAVETPQAEVAPRIDVASMKFFGPDGWSLDAPPPAIAPFDAVKAKAYQDLWAQHFELPVEFTNSIGMKFRLIPPGEFLMGSTPEQIDAALLVSGGDSGWKEWINSEPAPHKVILTQPLYLGVTEVTQSQYEQVMRTNPSDFSAAGGSKHAVINMETGQHPVENVSWNEAAEFCSRLSQKEKLKPSSVRSGAVITPQNGTGYRLPTEAEWEFACRAGTTTWFWSGDTNSDLVSIGWFGHNAGNRTHPVGELSPNPFGLFDMHGNVWEAVQDSWDPAASEMVNDVPVINPLSPFAVGSRPVFRGGNWDDHPTNCRSSTRLAHPATFRHYGIGLRAALSVDAVKKLVSNSK